MGNFYSGYMDRKHMLKTCRTGDILLIKGESFFSCTVRLFSMSNFSHVAMIIRENLDSDPLVFEATIDEGELKDIGTDR